VETCQTAALVSPSGETDELTKQGDDAIFSMTRLFRAIAMRHTIGLGSICES
jgi:hypothetical protein